jgi:two-component system, OmpR family, sensor histidine kinase KdpD
MYSPSSPDQLYTKTPRRGKHKIFIGMAPGVGKTYKMLEEGHRLRREGVDVVVGLLETHRRIETEQKAAGLEILPRQQVNYQGATLTEMDTAAIIQRRPQLVLIDELAHTNVPGSEHEKRYQDVEVVLSAGINVYSTMNIQHIESLNDTVAQITGVIVRERVPDRVLDEADELIVVDVTAETLQERLRDGKIYAPEKIDQSLQNFFQRRHLIALRELALREVADNVEETAVEDAGNNQVKTLLCNIHERVLVCVSTYPNSLQLLRRGARITNYMHGRLYVLFVDHPDRFLSKDESLHIETCEQICREFGGEFLRVPSQDVGQAIAETAKKHRISQIVMGESKKSRWQILLNGSLTHRILFLLKQVDVHIISTSKNTDEGSR